MKAEWLIIPDWENLTESVKTAEKFGAAFEYNDFFSPDVYRDPEEVEKRISGYLALNRDRRKDTLHGVFYDITAVSSDPVIRENSVKLMKQSLTIGRRLGVSGVIFHANLISGLRLQSYRNAWALDSEKLYRELCSEFPEMSIFVENTTEQEPDVLVALAEKMKDVPNFGLCFDYAHAALTSTPMDIWIREMGPYVRHIHINDHDNQADLHLVPGDGSLDFSYFAGVYEKKFRNVPVLLEVTGNEKAEKGLAYITKVEASETEEVSPKEPLSEREKMLLDVLETTRMIAGEKDKNKLLDLILSKSMDYAHCDAGTLYILKDGELHFKIMKTRSMGVDQGGDGTPIPLKPVALKKENVCGFAAMEQKLVNIPDVYDNKEFDFSGPRRYDEITGYRTGSMMAVPLTNQNDELLGVLQLINALDDEGRTIPFSHELESLFDVLAAQAAITMQQVAHVAEVREMTWSFAQAMAEAIDQRTPYNGSHTRKVAEYAGLLAKKINEKNKAGETSEWFDELRTEQLVLSAYLHDIGKMIIPSSVMNKETRLGRDEQNLWKRFIFARAGLKIRALEGKITQEEYESLKKQLDDAEELARSCNIAGFLTDDKLAALQEIFRLSYYNPETEADEPLFTETEKVNLMVRKGTLTEEERAVMEGHVVMTERILQKVRFSDEYREAPVFAAQHHEYLNGKGYPRHLSSADLSLETRILTAADICDALLASDRPYKKAMPKDRAFAILHSMAEEGSLDAVLVDYLQECLEEKETQM